MPEQGTTSFVARMNRLADGDTSFQMSKSALLSFDDDDNPFAVGSKRGWMPLFGRRTWQIAPHDEVAGFHAYLFEHAGREVGYVRVPHFRHSSSALEQFESIVAHFESRTNVMILDLVHTPGGSMFFMYALASMLTTRPLAVPTHVVALTADDVADAEDVLANAGAEPPECVRYARAILTEFRAGRWGSGRRSFPLHLGGITHIEPSPIRFSGEVVVLINERTASAGEFLAAIFQDHDMHTLFGARTAGAGGCARAARLPAALAREIDQFLITWTIARRTTGEMIEDFGVMPDVGYSITTEDLTSIDPLRETASTAFGFQPYRQALLRVVDDLLKGNAHGRHPVATGPLESHELRDVLAAHRAWRERMLSAQSMEEDDRCRRARLDHRSLAGLDLRHSDLSLADLRGAELRGTDLRGASLVRANLYRADLRNADLRGTNLAHAFLVEADLSGAMLSGASLRMADLTRACLRDVALEDCDVFDAYMPDDAGVASRLGP